MILRLQSFFAGFLALLVAALLALGSASAKPASGGYQLFEPVALEHQHHIQLASLGNFDYHAKIASECCNAPNRIDDALPDTVYCGDGSGVGEIFENGFQPKKPDAKVDLEDSVNSEPSPDSQYVSTSKDLDVATDFATEYGTQSGNVYDMDTPLNGIDVEKTLGSKARYDESEIAIPDGSGVPGCSARGCQPVNPDGSPAVLAFLTLNITMENNMEFPIFLNGHQVQSTTLEFADLGNRRLQIHVTGGVSGGDVFEDWDYFSALSKLRLKLEGKGYRIGCVGSLENFYPSNMSLDMGLGKVVYLMEMGKKAGRSSQAQTFAICTEFKRLASVEKQKRFFQNWKKAWPPIRVF